MKAYFLTVMICGSMLLSLSAFGAVILVPTDQPTIAAAIAAATIMDQIAIEPGTYTESGLVITQDLTISAQNWGDPADHIIQADVTAGTATDRIFSVTSGRVTLRGLTIRHGNVVGDGGAVLCSGAATILSVSNCVFVDNIAVAGAGGAVYSDQAVSDFWQCDIFGNTAAGGGGGVYMIGGSTNFSQNTVSGNLAADGGGMYFFDCAAWTTNCTVSANTATGNGGGISFNFSAPGIDSYTTNSTVSGNNANQGGGISVDIAAASTATLRHLTVASNVAGNDGGGIIAGGAAAPDLQACIIANNNAPMDVDISGTVNSLDYNLIEDITGATITGVTTNNITGGDPNIGPLADNGGSTMTH
ncbi:MAG: hypothetical protein KAH38_05100, partial [Candidatus Hydrogenedentes bacterium]|nr:hypothetical protein [Candidatus Hydrogenedentota bacterium]